MEKPGVMGSAWKARTVFRLQGTGPLRASRPPQCSHGWAGWGRGSHTSQRAGGLVPGHGHLLLRPPAPVAWCVTGLFAVASTVLARLAVTSEVCV